MQVTPPLWQKVKRNKEPLEKVKEEREKAGLKPNIQINEEDDIWSHHFTANRWANNRNRQTLFSWAPKSLQLVTAVMKLKGSCSLGEKQ